MGDGADERLVRDAKLLPFVDGLLFDLFPVFTEYIVQFSVAQGQILVHFLVLLFGNFLPLFRDDFHNLFGVQLRSVLFNNLSALLRKEQVRAQRFPRRLHICFDLLLFFVNVGFLQVPVLLVPKVPFLALLKRLKLCLGSLQIEVRILQVI
jgi:hypothetical protein